MDRWARNRFVVLTAKASTWITLLQTGESVYESITNVGQQAYALLHRRRCWTLTLCIVYTPQQQFETNHYSLFLVNECTSSCKAAR